MPKKIKDDVVQAKIAEAIRDGRVELNVPEAAECMPNFLRPEEIDPDTAPLHYLRVEHIKAYHRFRGKKACYNHDGALLFQWGIKGFGFGEVTLRFRDGQTIVNDEGMGAFFVARLMMEWMWKLAQKQINERSTKVH